MSAVSPDPAAGARPRSQESLLDLVQSIVRDLPALVGDRVELFSLEMQRATSALVKIAALAAAALLFALTAWLALWGVVVGLLLALDWHWAPANAVALLINAGAAAWALLRARSLIKLLSLPATRRHLMLGLGDVSRAKRTGATDEQRPDAKPTEPRPAAAA
jgi:uncharacterized membrane protein YqjE